MFSTIYLRLEGKVPPGNWDWTKHECYRKQIISLEVSKCILQSIPPFHHFILCLKRKLVNFNFRGTFENLNFWFSGHSDIGVRQYSFLDYIQLLMIGQPGWWTQTLSITHLQPRKMKCLIFDYVQLLMISQGGLWTWTPSAIPLWPQKMKCLFLDYVQLLMISQAIWAMKVVRNAKKWLPNC